MKIDEVQSKFQIDIDNELFDLVPRPTKEQYTALYESIKQQGQLVPITVDSTGKILDGHTRYDICENLGIKTDYVIKEFKSAKEQRLFVVTSNLKRRHLNEFQIYELFEKEIEIMSHKKHSEGVKRGHQVRKGELPAITLPERYGRTLEHDVEKLTGVRSSTVTDIRYLKKHGTPEQIEQVRKGIDKLYPIVQRIQKIKNPQVKINSGNTSRNKIIIFHIILKYLKENNNVIIHVLTFKTRTAVGPVLKILTSGVNAKLIDVTFKKGKYSQTKSKEHQYYSITPNGLLLLDEITTLLEKLPISVGGLKKEK